MEGRFSLEEGLQHFYITSLLRFGGTYGEVVF